MCVLPDLILRFISHVGLMFSVTFLVNPTRIADLIRAFQFSQVNNMDAVYSVTNCVAIKCSVSFQGVLIPSSHREKSVQASGFPFFSHA